MFKKLLYVILYTKINLIKTFSVSTKEKITNIN